MSNQVFPHLAFSQLNALWQQRERVFMLRSYGNPLTIADLQKQTVEKIVALQQAKATICVICRDNRLSFFSDFLACAFSGVNVVLPPNGQPKTLVDVYSLANADAIFSDTENTLQPIEGCHDFGDINNITITVFTSGSTGKPKAIAKPLSAYLSEVETLESLWGEILTEATLLSSVSLQHVYGFLFGALWPLTYAHRVWGESVGFEERLHYLTKTLARTVFVSSPALLTRLTEKFSNIGLQIVFSSGGVLSDEYAKSVEEKLKTRCLRIFGSSETGGVAWQNNENSYWNTLPHVQVSEENGVLHIQSPYSYQSPYLTADRVTLLSDKTFILKGRADEIVKIGDKRVALLALEQALVNLASINMAKVVVLSEPRRVLGAVLVLNEEGKQAQQKNPNEFYRNIKHALSLRFEAVTLPKFFRIVYELPENAQGKVLKSDLLDLFSERQK